jgi:hypothetical protein
VLSHYLDSLLQQGFATQTNGAARGHPLQIRRVLLKNGQGIPATEFCPGDSFTVELHFSATYRIDQPYFWLGVDSQFGPVFCASMLLDGRRPDFIEGEGVIACSFPSLPLMPQLYTLSFGVRARDGVTLLTPTQQLGFFVSGKMSALGFAGDFAESIAGESHPLVLPYEWHFPDGRTASVAVTGFNG